MINIHTYLFDLDNTILNFNAAEHSAIKKAIKSFGLEPTEEILARYSELNLAQWKLLELGQTTVPKLKIQRFKNLISEYDLDFSPEKAAEIYESFLSEGHEFMPGALDMLTRLKEKNYRIYIVTNGISAVQRRRTKESGITDFAEDIFISEEIGINKPDIGYFKYVFDHIPDFDAKSTAIVGDSLSSDIKGGITAGIHTIWFNPKHQENASDIQPEYEISTLSSIPLR